MFAKLITWVMSFFTLQRNSGGLSLMADDGSLSKDNYSKLIKNCLLQAVRHNNIRSSQTYELTLHIYKSNPYSNFFTERFDNQSIPFTEDSLFRLVESAVIKRRFESSYISTVLEVHEDGSSFEEAVSFQEQTYSSDFEIQVFASTLENKVDTLPLPALADFTVGRVSQNDNPDVVIGDYDELHKYPPRVEGSEANEGYSLLTILSGYAFTFERYGANQWLCQARRQGQFMKIENEHGKSDVPLDFPDRKAIYRLGDTVVVYEHPSHQVDRLYFKIAKITP